MRASVIRSAVVLGAVGAVTGVLAALGLHWWAVRDSPTNVGIQGYAVYRRYVDYVAVDNGTDWWGLLWPAAATGLAVGVIAAIVIALLGRRLTLERTR